MHDTSYDLHPHIENLIASIVNEALMTHGFTIEKAASKVQLIRYRPEEMKAELLASPHVIPLRTTLLDTPEEMSTMQREHLRSTWGKIRDHIQSSHTYFSTVTIERPTDEDPEYPECRETGAAVTIRIIVENVRSISLDRSVRYENVLVKLHRIGLLPSLSERPWLRKLVFAHEAEEMENMIDRLTANI